MVDIYTQKGVGLIPKHEMRCLEGHLWCAARPMSYETSVQK